MLGSRSTIKCLVITFTCAKLFACRAIRTIICHNTLTRYSGTFCGSTFTKGINHCHGIVCQNGGTCVDGLNACVCDCVDGFSGTFCESTLTKGIHHPSYRCLCSVVRSE